MANVAITIIASTKTYENLKTFKDVEQLNEAVRAHVSHNKKELNKNAVRILRHIKQYSCKYPGVSFLTKNNIAAALGISKRTVIRNCNLLQELGIIKQYEMKRKKDMLQTSNAIVIQPFNDGEYSDNDKQENGKMSPHKNNTFKTQKQEIYNKKNATPDELKLLKYIQLKIKDSKLNIKFLSSYLDKLINSIVSNWEYNLWLQMNKKKRQQKQRPAAQMPFYNWLV